MKRSELWVALMVQPGMGALKADKICESYGERFGFDPEGLTCQQEPPVFSGPHWTGHLDQVNVSSRKPGGLVTAKQGPALREDARPDADGGEIDRDYLSALFDLGIIKPVGDGRFAYVRETPEDSVQGEPGPIVYDFKLDENGKRQVVRKGLDEFTSGPMADKPTAHWQSLCCLRFKSSACGYTGGADNCNKTFDRCRQLGNQARFGGHVLHEPEIRNDPPTAKVYDIADLKREEQEAERKRTGDFIGAPVSSYKPGVDPGLDKLLAAVAGIAEDDRREREERELREALWELSGVPMTDAMKTALSHYGIDPSKVSPAEADAIISELIRKETPNDEAPFPPAPA